MNGEQGADFFEMQPGQPERQPLILESSENATARSMDQTPVDPPTPAAVDPEVQFEEHFDAYVASVRDKGGPTEFLFFLNKARGVRWGTGLGVTTGAIAEIPNVGARLVAVCLMAGAVAVAHFRGRSKAFDHLPSDLRDAVGDHFEVYRAKKTGEIGVYWAGITWNYDDEGRIYTPREHLLQMAERSARNGVAELSVPGEVAKDILAEPYAGSTTMTVGEWMAQYAGIAVGKNREEGVLIVNRPAEWLKLLGNTSHAKGTVLVDALLTTLGQVDPLHPLVRIGEEYASYPELRDERLLRAARQAVQDRTSATEVLPQGHRLDLAHGAARTASVPVTGRIIEKSENGAVVDADSVALTVQRRLDRIESLQQILGISPETFCAIVKAPHENVPLAKKVLEYLLYQATVRPDEQMQEQLRTVLAVQTEDASEDSPGWMLADPIQDTIIKPSQKTWIDDYKQRWTVATTAIAACFIAIAGTMTVDEILSERYEEAASYARAAIAREQGATRPESIPREQVDDRIWQDSPELGVWGAIDHMRQGLGSKAPAASGSKSSSKPEANNSDGQPNRVEWIVQGHDGMQTEGYYFVDTRTVLHGKDGPNGPLEWHGAEQMPYTSYKLPTASDGWLGVPRITVSRSIDQDEYGDYNEATDTVAFPIAVLENTVPVSATLDGQPVTVRKKADGTFAMHPSSGKVQGGQLSYTLVRFNDSLPHAASRFGQRGVRLDGAAIDRYWNARIPGLASPLQPGLRTKMIEQYVGRTFSYELEPFPPNWSTRSGLEYTRQVGGRQEADCYAAAGLLALENESLAMVGGFRNNAGEGAEIISTREAHAWVADASGERYDATPSRSEDSAALAAYFDEGALVKAQQTPPQKPPERVPVLPFLAVGVVAAVGIAARRRLKNAGHLIGSQAKVVVATAANLTADYALYRLSQESSNDLAAARILAQQAVYASHQAELRVGEAMSQQPQPSNGIEEINKMMAQHLGRSAARQAVGKALGRSTTVQEWSILSRSRWILALARIAAWRPRDKAEDPAAIVVLD